MIRKYLPQLRFQGRVILYEKSMILKLITLFYSQNQCYVKVFIVISVTYFENKKEERKEKREKKREEIDFQDGKIYEDRK